VLVVVGVFAVAGVIVTAGSAEPAGPGPGNSPNAKSCEKGGWQDLVRSDGSVFASQGECTSYAAQGGTLRPVNQGPVAEDDANSVKEDAAPNSVSGNVLSNDTDADGDSLSVTSTGTFSLAHGSLVINADGSYSYTLNNSDPAVNALNDGDTLIEAFTYTVSDGNGGTDSAKLTITINGTTD
jgi:VCBS repeat-containing protein